MSNSTHYATTDYEFLVATMKQNPLCMLAVTFFALLVTTLWLLEMIYVLGVDKIASAVIAQIQTIPASLRRQSWWVENCINCALSLSTWVLERDGMLIVGICTGIYSAVSSFGIFLDAAFVVTMNICTFPFSWTFHLAEEVLELMKMILNGLFGVVKLLFRMPIAFVEWNFLVAVSLLVQTFCVFMAECSEQSKKLTRAFEIADTYMRTQFCADKMKELREVLTRCQTIVNTFLLSIFVVMCWWSLCFVHSAIFWTTGWNIAFYITGHVWHADMSLHAMIRCLVIVGEFLAKQLLKHLSPTVTNTFAYLKISFGGLFETFETMTLRAIAPVLSSHDGNALDVGGDVWYGDYSTYGIVCYLFGLVKYIVVQFAEYIWFAATRILGYAASAFNAMLSSSNPQLTVGPH